MNEPKVYLNARERVAELFDAVGLSIDRAPAHVVALCETEVEDAAREAASTTYHDDPAHPEFCPQNRPCSCERKWREFLHRVGRSDGCVEVKR